MSASVADLYDLWLKPWHLPPDKVVNVTIQKAEPRLIHPRPTEEKTALILSFVGKNRKLILNSTNANALADLGGEDYTGLPHPSTFERDDLSQALAILTQMAATIEPEGGAI